LVWSNVPPGHFVLTAVAGEKGSQIKSPNVQITVKDTPASVTITAPTNNATFGPGAGIVLAADVTLGDQPLQRVSFWVDEHLVGIATNAPYTTTWAKPSVGKHMAVARAIDTFGVVGTSSAVKFSVTNAAPTVTLTSPADHSTYTAPAEITFTADAADSDGTISRVTFWANNRLIGTATTAPYTVTWKHVPAGQYAIEAHAVDNSGTVANSAPILIVVNRK
jgi:predicted phage tail protein